MVGGINVSAAIAARPDGQGRACVSPAVVICYSLKNNPDSEYLSVSLRFP
jgi:hypothetical protein